MCVEETYEILSGQMQNSYYIYITNQLITLEQINNLHSMCIVYICYVATMDVLKDFYLLKNTQCISTTYDQKHIKGISSFHPIFWLRNNCVVTYINEILVLETM